MTETTNTYFKRMQEVLTEYSNAKKLRYDENINLQKAGKWDEVKSWEEREKAFKKPYSEGFMDAYWTWMDNREKANSMFEVHTLPWAQNAHDYITCLKEAGITEMAITDQSTGLMTMLHRFAEEGCQIKGLCKVTRTERHWGETQTVEQEGILISLN